MRPTTVISLAATATLFTASCADPDDPTTSSVDQAASVTFSIDPSIAPAAPLPGLDHGPPRPIGAIVDANRARVELAAEEVIFQPSSPAELADVLARYGGTVLRDGVPIQADGEGLPGRQVELTPSGWYLIHVDPRRSTLADLSANLAAAGASGHYRLSSENAARTLAMILRERAHGIALGPDLVGYGAAVLEHPDGMGGNIDFETQTWMSETSALSTGVVHAWRYVDYKGFGPMSGSWTSPHVAIIDGGFDLDASTGLPLAGNVDYYDPFSKPPQGDLIDHDGTAGGPNTMTCSGGSACPWHGQSVFGVAAAVPKNGFGAAGTGGPFVRPMLFRVSGDIYTWADAIRSAAINGARVINLSLEATCGPWKFFCDLAPGDGGILGDPHEMLEQAVDTARGLGAIVVAAAGNAGLDLDGNDVMPCEIDGVVCVSSVTSSLASSFNWGSSVDIWAPTGIRSTPNPVSSAGDADSVGLDELPSFGGTSSSSPFVAGVVGMMKTIDVWLLTEDAVDTLQTTANHDPSPTADPEIDDGWVDAFEAVRSMAPNLAPSASFTTPAPGAIVGYHGITLGATVTDPELAALPPGVFLPSVEFRSSIDGVRCVDSAPPYACSSGPLTIGSHVITLTATDAFGATAVRTRNISVVNHLPTIDVLEPLAGGAYFDSNPVDLGAYPYDADQFVPNSAVQWTSSLDGVLGSGWSREELLSEGVHVLTATVTDELGATASDSVMIEVQSGDGYPSVEILLPSGGAFAPGETIAFEGEAFDAEDGTLSGASLVWTSSIDGVIGTGTTFSTSELSGPAMACNPEFRTHVITLTATDSEGNSMSTTVTVLVGILC
jgi:hypothetical protein